LNLFAFKVLERFERLEQSKAVERLERFEPAAVLRERLSGLKVYELAKGAGRGREIPTEWFLQDIRD
jgi:hypothetical protein